MKSKATTDGAKEKMTQGHGWNIELWPAWQIITKRLSKIQGGPEFLLLDTVEQKKFFHHLIAVEMKARSTLREKLEARLAELLGQGPSLEDALASLNAGAIPVQPMPQSAAISALQEQLKGLDKNEEQARRLLFSCYRRHPDVTCFALPRLRARIAKFARRPRDYKNAMLGFKSDDFNPKQKASVNTRLGKSDAKKQAAAFNAKPTT